MATENDAMEVYFDESGHTGEDLANPDQRNLLVAAVVISTEADRPFWMHVREAWSIAGALLAVAPETLELKGAELYGGKGQFAGVPGQERLRVISTVIEALVRHAIPVLWQGGPKHLWRERTKATGRAAPNFYKSVLFAWCALLHENLTLLFPNERFRVIGDENASVRAGMALHPPKERAWPRFVDGSVAFLESSRAHGLQVADVVVHTLYRASKGSVPEREMAAAQLSNTDMQADAFRRRLAEAGLLKLADR